MASRPSRPGADRQEPRRPFWFDAARTPYLARHLPYEPDTGSPKVSLHGHCNSGWIRAEASARSTAAPAVKFRVTHPPEPTLAEARAAAKANRASKRAKTAKAVKTKDVPRRIFSLRLDPTPAQKRFFQRAIGIACLAKRLAYKHVGDQRQPMTAKRINDLKKRICTEHFQTRVMTGETSAKGNARFQKQNAEQPNAFLPEGTRRRLYEQDLRERAKAHRGAVEAAWCARRGWKKSRKTWTPPLDHRPIPAVVRCNAVIRFCQSVSSTQALMQEQAAKWDARMAASQPRSSPSSSSSTARRTDVSSARGKRKQTEMSSASPAPRAPTNPRPCMGPRQVKATDRNRPHQTFSIDATPGNANPHAARWDFKGDDRVHLMGIAVRLWGRPAKRRRELDRLSSRMPDGERFTDQRVIVRYESGRYHLLVQCLFSEPPKRADIAGRPVSAVALDPGARTFHGTYDLDGRFGEIGAGQIRRIIRIAKKADRIKSHIDRNLKDRRPGDHNKAKRKRARRKVRAIMLKTRDLKSDAHWKVAKALCERYDHVLIPRLPVSVMVRALARSTTRQMMHWSHYEFRQRLHHKAAQLGVHVHEVSEAYTSMTCGRCLWIEESFRRNSSKQFACRRCGHTADRDLNAARNIMLKTIEASVGTLEASILQPPSTSPTSRG
ncbi:transposase [Pandoravirus neocaledonia]|uniref:Transposase n=1 Tax=Pandoravirus neocaledonia TaxID=2107708 RepID=A0A2U7UDF9_9VIRU|nr:transposase [Pandoravirus neocaledonia]AVK76442.1 Transposase [Pandoravirus neocaledonia]